MIKTSHKHKVILPIITTLLLIFLSTVNWAQASPQPAEPSGAPTIVSYQGQIWDGDTPYNAEGFFKFAIVSDIGEPYWANDIDFPPTHSVTLKVENGLFSVNLGDTSLVGMNVPIDATVFKDTNTFLRVWFSPDDSTWIQLPDQPIAAVPYALQAQLAINAVSAENADDADTLDGKHAAAFQLRVTGTCPTGQSIREIKSDGTVLCEIDDSMTYTNGTGILLSGNTFSADPAYLQRRVSTSCVEGSAIKTINSDGTLVCETIPQPVTFTTNSIATDGGAHNSITIGADGLGLIVYNNGGSLRVAHCEDIACSTVTTSLLNSSSSDGYYTSIAIGVDGLPLISFYDAAETDLKVAHCQNTSCSSATITTLDGSGYNAGLYTSIAIGADELGLISYYDLSNSNLKIAHCSNTACTSASITAFVETDDGGRFTSLTIGRDGLGLISYQHTTTSSLKVLHCDNWQCTSGTRTVLDTGGFDGSSSAITIGSDGLGLISYFNNTLNYLKVAQCSNLTCTGSINSVVVIEASEMTNPSITIGLDGFGLISYGVMNVSPEIKSLKIAHCNNLACSRAYTYTLDASGSMGWYNDITIGMDGYALISYSDLTNPGLKVAHCSNLFCNPDY